MTKSSETAGAVKRRLPWILPAGVFALFFPIASWMAGYFFGATQIVDETTRVLLDFAFLAHDEHAMAVAAGIWPASTPPFERDFKEIVSDMIECRRLSGCGDLIETTGLDFATISGKSRILAAAARLLESPDKDLEPPFLSPWFALYGKATAPAVVSFMENNRREARLKEALDGGMLHVDLTKQTTVSDVLKVVFEAMSERCPWLCFRKEEGEDEIAIFGYIGNLRNKSEAVPDFTVDALVESMPGESLVSPSACLDKLRNDGLVRYSHSATNFFVSVSRNPKQDGF